MSFVADYKIFKYKSLVKEFNAELEAGTKRNVRAAALYVKKRLKQNIKKKFGKGELWEGVAVNHEKTRSLVGYTKPASHAHLVEFGTDRRFVKNWFGHKGLSFEVGAMPPKPVLIPTINNSVNQVEKILGEPLIKGDL